MLFCGAEHKSLTCCTLAVVIALSVVLRKNRHFPSKGWRKQKEAVLGLIQNKVQ